MESTEFFILLFFHLSFLILAFGSVMVTDLYGLLWMLDRVRFNQIVDVSSVTEKFIWIGWIGMVAVGIPMIIMKGEVDNLMTIKLALVGLVGLNGYPLHLLQKKLEEFKDKDTVPGIFIFRLGLSISLSQIGWWGAVLIGFLHRHVQTIINWPDRPWLYIGLFIAGFIIIWAIGEVILKQKEDEAYVET
ncbi:MAG: hypothetical protein WD604_12095 [Balneolaceae bacterium]